MNQEQLKEAILARIDEIVRLYNEEQEQVKKPALMSDDGVILSYGMDVWMVTKSGWLRGVKDKPDKFVLNNIMPINKHKYCYFSTKEKAQEYLDKIFEEKEKYPLIGQKEIAKIIERAKKEEYVRGYKEGDIEGYTRGYDVGYQEGVNSQEIQLREEKGKSFDEGYHAGRNDLDNEVQKAESEGYQKGLKKGIEEAEEKAKVARRKGYNEALKAVGRY